MTTGAHTLNLTAANPTYGRAIWTFRAVCSCGTWSAENVTREHARILHGTHFDTVVNDALDARQQAEKH